MTFCSNWSSRHAFHLSSVVFSLWLHFLHWFYHLLLQLLWQIIDEYFFRIFQHSVCVSAALFGSFTVEPYLFDVLAKSSSAYNQIFAVRCQSLSYFSLSIVFFSNDCIHVSGQINQDISHKLLVAFPSALHWETFLDFVFWIYLSQMVQSMAVHFFPVSIYLFTLFSSNFNIFVLTKDYFSIVQDHAASCV